VSSNETVVIAAAPREDRGRRGSATAGSATVELRAAHVRGSRGPVFGPLTATSRSLVTVGLGPRGSGRTSLLLSIAGRMQLSGGSLSTMGATSPAEIRRLTGLVGFEAVDALEPAVTLGATLRERLSWALPWYRRTPRITPQLARELLADAFGDLEQPGPALLVVDDFDALRDPADRALVAERLSDLAQQGIRIVLASSDPGDAALLERALPAGAAPALIEL
jgi:hypothetical protein